MTAAVQQDSDYRYTMAEWLALGEDEPGWKVELLDGDIVVSPPPFTDHQDIALELAVAFRVAIAAADRTDLRAYVDTGVDLGPNGLIPDVLLARGPFRREALLPAERVELAVEIVSPSSRRRDRVRKPLAYAAAGIAFYWRVEPETPGGPVLVTHRLGVPGPDGVRGYTEVERLVPGRAAAVSAAPVPLTLDPGTLLDY